ncbi:hypothetical protein ACPDHQ_12635 [Myroides odoratimimus]|uniref:hypothetical protein n=1 Tax=Myroides odoratimimus TaxID=76832 RepID=UPI003D2F6FB6
MPKRLGLEPIYIAPEISGYIDHNGNPQVIDERTNTRLNPNDPFDKITIYERQVKGWFLHEADKLIRYRNKNKGFIVLMICLSYFEGVEEYKTGRLSNNNSKQFFRNSIERLYPGQFTQIQLDELYGQGRCGLFHNGMVRGQIIIRNSFQNSIEFDNQRIKISPKKLLTDIMDDFENFISLLRQDQNARNNFNNLYTNL